MGSRIVGNEGNVSIGTHNIVANAWSMSISRPLNDVTGFADDTAQVRGGVPTYSGSISGFMDDSSAPTLSKGSFNTGDVVAVALIAQSGNQWSGDAVVSGVSVSSSKTGDATISFDFTFTGDVTEAWS